MTGSKYLLNEGMKNELQQNRKATNLITDKK
jgi:hypothetical protein